MNVWGEGLGLLGQAQIQLAKDAVQMVTESVQGLFYRLGVM